MAYCQTDRWANKSPYVKLTVTEKSSTATVSTLSWTLQYIADSEARTSVAKQYTVTIAGKTVKSGTYDINKKVGTYTIASGTIDITKTNSSQTISFGCSMAFNLTWSGVYGGTKTASGSITVPAISVYTISYDANGGSGAPGSQTKSHGVNLTLSTTTPTRTGYTFLGWGTSSTDTSVDYKAGATYTTDASITLYAIWKAHTYIIKYNYNGGGGPALADQTKTYGVDIKITSLVPTRQKYRFLGWGTSANATTVAYNSGATYSNNAPITLYAVWELIYIAPQIINPTIMRCDSAGASDEMGTYALVAFTWTSDQTVSYIKIQHKLSTDSKWSNDVETTPNTTSGEIYQIIGGGALDAEYTYDILITIRDSLDYITESFLLPGTHYVIDILAGGKGVAFNKPAELDGVMDVDYSAKFRQPVVFDESVTFNVKPQNKVLWSGALHMNGEQTITLNEAISEQEHGIVLVWSYYTDADGAKDHSFNTFFISKYQVIAYANYGHTFIMGINAGFSSMGAKYVYFTDKTITGHSGNTTSGTNSGIMFNNTNYVLRCVIGM